jgi:predicted homoserine dehydrogenase-like protein
MKRIARRDFLKTSSAIAAFTVLKPHIVFGSTNNSAINVGFIGCGNRGTSVISSMSKYTNINIFALADLFEDQLSKASKTLNAFNSKKRFSDIHYCPIKI